MTELEKYYSEKARLPKGMFPKLDKDDERVMRFMEGYAKEVVKKLNIDDVSESFSKTELEQQIANLEYQLSEIKEHGLGDSDTALTKWRIERDLKIFKADLNSR